jgi:hypothetical protein
MSRSNPSSENPHPCQLWLEWKGGPGHFTYWDKNKGTEGERVALDVGSKPFRCIALDRTATVRGYSKHFQSGLHCNEVRDTRTDPLTVRLFSTKQTIASGMWNDIKDVVTSKRNGGSFGVNLYMAYKDGADLKIGCLQLTGCALGPWFEFEKANRKGIWEKGIAISMGQQEESGGVEFIPPVFSLCEVSAETDMAAKKLDVELQAYLKDYFARTHAPAGAANPAPGLKVLPAAPHDEEPQPAAPLDEPPPMEDVPF